MYRALLHSWCPSRLMLFAPPIGCRLSCQAAAAVSTLLATASLLAVAAWQTNWTQYPDLAGAQASPMWWMRGEPSRSCCSLEPPWRSTMCVGSARPPLPSVRAVRGEQAPAIATGVY